MGLRGQQGDREGSGDYEDETGETEQSRTENEANAVL